MKETLIIFWFRRDLRLEDNVGLYHALNNKYNVLPIFIFDKDILESLPKNDARVNYIHKTLCNINDTLKEKNVSSIATFHNKPLYVCKQLVSKYSIYSVFTNHDYEPYAIKRDIEVKEFLKTKDIDFKSFKDQVIFETNEVIKDDGTPYKVYTPYSKKWMEALKNSPLEYYNSQDLLSNLVSDTNVHFLSLNEIGFKKSNQTIESYNVTESIINQYEGTRNFPAKEGTSKLGPHLRFGTVSVRKMVQKARKSSNNTFLKELTWRDFFIQLL